MLRENPSRDKATKQAQADNSVDLIRQEVVEWFWFHVAGRGIECPKCGAFKDYTW